MDHAEFGGFGGELAGFEDGDEVGGGGAVYCRINDVELVAVGIIGRGDFERFGFDGQRVFGFAGFLDDVEKRSFLG